MQLFGYSIPNHMDYEGQKLAEALLQYIIIMFASVGFVWGYLCQQFEQTVYVTLAGVTLAFIVCLPPWPIYRRHPVKWLKKTKS
eukprot:gene5065-8762_t